MERLQKETDSFIDKIVLIAKTKEKEIMTIDGKNKTFSDYYGW